MAGAFITIEIDAPRIRAALERLQQATGDVTPALEDIGELLLKRHRDRWELAVSPAGVPWKRPLSKVTLAKKSQNLDKILVETGQLSEHLHYQIEGGALLFGTNEDYGATHQFGMKKGYAGRTTRGAPIPWGDIPARPFLGISEDDEGDILDLLKTHLDGAILGH